MPFYLEMSTNISSMMWHLKFSYISILTNLVTGCSKFLQKQDECNKERIFDKHKMSNVKKANQYFVDLPILLANDLLVKMTKKMFEAHYLVNR